MLLRYACQAGPAPVLLHQALTRVYRSQKASTHASKASVSCSGLLPPSSCAGLLLLLWLAGTTAAVQEVWTLPSCSLATAPCPTGHSAVAATVAISAAVAVGGGVAAGAGAAGGAAGSLGWCVLSARATSRSADGLCWTSDRLSLSRESAVSDAATVSSGPGMRAADGLNYPVCRCQWMRRMDRARAARACEKAPYVQLLTLLCAPLFRDRFSLNDACVCVGPAEPAPAR